MNQILVMLQKTCKKIADSNKFQTFIILTILFTSLIVGLQTYKSLTDTYGVLFDIVDLIILAIFTIEIIIRVLAYLPTPLQFFKSPWNLFDFFVTVIFYVPGIGTMAGILRIARVFRVLRLATALPRLQMIVGALIKSIPSVTYVGVLLTILFFIYGVIGCILFGEVTPDKFGNLHKSMITLAQIITLEGWTAVMEAQKNPLIAAPYFLSFILVGTMIVLNLFIGVILMGFEEVNEEMLEEKAKQDKHTATTEIGEINHDLDQIKQKLIKLSAEIRVSQNKNKTK